MLNSIKLLICKAFSAIECLISVTRDSCARRGTGFFTSIIQIALDNQNDLTLEYQFSNIV